MTVLSGTVTLSRAFLQTADGSISVTCGTSGSQGGGGTKTDAFQQDGTFRNYATGVTRLVMGTTTTRVQSFTLRALTPAQQTAVSNMLGKTCLYRDTYGRRIWGAFTITSTVTIPLSGNLADITIAFQSVTYDESV